MKKLFILCSFILVSVGAWAQVGEKDSTVNLEGSDTFEYVDKVPTFPGGMEAYENFFNENLNYPKYALRHNIQGEVSLSVIIDEHGSLKKEKLLNAPHASLGKEALRLIKMMPAWEPGTMNGNPVPVKTTIRIKFTLRDSEPVKKDNGAKIEKK